MSDCSNISYKHNFLDQVIMRIDFLEFIENDFLNNNELVKLITTKYPKRAKDKIVHFNDFGLKIDSKTAPTIENSSMAEGIQIEYSDLLEKNKIIITNKSLTYSINAYNNFDDHYNFFAKIVTLFFRENNLSSRRLGIRYINIFDNDKIKIHSNFFSKNITNFISLGLGNNEFKKQCTRSLALTEYRMDDMSLNFRYGLYNKNYPNFLDNNGIILDMDCYTISLFSNLKDILDTIINGHNSIQHLFENVITDKLRGIMNE